MEIFGDTITGSSGMNADNYYYNEKYKIFVLSDGASGAFDKVASSKICIDSFKENKPKDIQCCKEYLFETIKKANNKLINKSQRDNGLSFATLSAAMIKKNTLHISVIGDSPILLIRDKEINKLSKPIKKYQPLIDWGFFSEEECEKHIKKLPHYFWSMFDNFIPMVVLNIFYKEIKLIKDDIVILCSDGITDLIEEKNLCSIFEKSKDFISSNKQIMELVKSASVNQDIDDSTIISIKI